MKSLLCLVELVDVVVAVIMKRRDKYLAQQNKIHHFFAVERE